MLRPDHCAAAIAVNDIAQRLGGRWVLRGISLAVDPGAVVAVVGHNGSGQTTLLRALSRARIGQRVFTSPVWSRTAAAASPACC